MAQWRANLRANFVAQTILIACLPLLLVVLCSHAVAEEPRRTDSIESRLQELERGYSQLAEENRHLKETLQELRSTPQNIPELKPDIQDASEESHKSEHYTKYKFYADYSDGFLIAPVDRDDTPFSLKFNNETMFRYVAFGRDVRTWTDSAGVTSPVTNRSNFEIPRGRLIFSGNALLPDLSYYINIDYNTVTSEPIGFRGYWLSYEFDRSLQIFVGQNKVPGSREWLMSSFGAQGPDRTLATTFFRPSLSQGVWFTGEPLDGIHYHAMLSNGFNTNNVAPNKLDSRFCWSGSLWFEPLGNYGRTFSDLDYHEESAIRMGTSLTFSTEQGQQGNPEDPENAEIRLSDGTVITDTGALAPGVTLQKYKIGLAAFDFGWKRCGWSLSTEVYLQDLFGLQGNGPLPLNSTFAYGGYVQLGYFIVPKEVEVYARTSHVRGDYGTGGEYGGGCNWFLMPGKDNLRFTVDATWINRSPADQNRTDYRAGDTGFLLRSQIQLLF